MNGDGQLLAYLCRDAGPSPALRESEHHRDLYKNYDKLKDRIGFVPQQAVAGIPRRAGRATRPP
jgi:hypothetical protein